jgi:ketosteroid isomerase-like protein
MRTQEQLLDGLFAAITARDLDAVAELYSEDMQIWNSANRHTLDRDGSLAVLRSFLKRTEQARYEVLERRFWDGGAMQRHVLHIRVAGAEHELDVCITFAFEDGYITRIFEYLDGRALAPLGW